MKYMVVDGTSEGKGKQQRLIAVSCLCNQGSKARNIDDAHHNGHYIIIRIKI